MTATLVRRVTRPPRISTTVADEQIVRDAHDGVSQFEHFQPVRWQTVLAALEPKQCPRNATGAIAVTRVIHGKP